MMSATHYRLDNLAAIVDRNHLQQGATTEETNDLEPLADKARAFGFRRARDRRPRLRRDPGASSPPPPSPDARPW
ncbi:MAG: hypothetical protein QM804_02510 [Propionicimonas sp.]